MGNFDNPNYDDPREWINNKRKRSVSWEELKLACKKDEAELLEFLNRKAEEDYWLFTTTEEWYEFIKEQEEYEKDQKSLRFTSSDGALFDGDQENNLGIPKNPRSSWQLYKKSLDWKPESINDLEKATLGILRKLSDNTQTTGAIKGLVVGHVQSGKTANMEALMAMAADHGWNLFIVLSGSIENLRLQTLRRMQNDLNHQGNLNWIGIEHPSKSSAIGLRTRDLRFEHSSNMRYFTVCLKNASRLRSLIEWLNEDSASHNQMKILIIDDEADQASISNTATTPEQALKERKGINKLIVDLVEDRHHKGEKNTRGKAQAINYIMYTATPYANFLNEATPDSLYPKDFIWALKASDEYIGPLEIYGSAENENDDGIDVERIIPEKDLDIISDIYDGNITKIPTSLEDSIYWFICSSGVMRYLGYKKPISMLIHTSQKQINHDYVAQAINHWYERKSLDAKMISECERIYTRETTRITKEKWLTQFPSYGVAPDNINDYPEFNTIRPYIEEIIGTPMSHIKMTDEGDLQYHKGIHFVIDNCSYTGISTEDEYIRLAYPDPSDKEHYPKPAPLFMIVGGSTLSRGLTIEGLVSTFFLRASCQADTLMQMGRWFGYRKGYELLIRIWMTSDTTEKFRFLSDLEMDLRNDLKKYMYAGTRPDEWGPKLRCSPKVSWLRLTSRKHSTNAVAAEMDFTGAKPQTTVFENDEKILKHNFDLATSFLDNLPGEPKISYSGSALFWENIPLKVITEDFLLNDFAFSNRSKVFNEVQAFIDWIKGIPETDINNWTVIAAGIGNVRKSHLADKKHWNVHGYNIGKVNRSKIQAEEADNTLNIKVLRALKDLIADIDKKYIKEYKENSPEDINTQKAVDDIRKAAGKEKIPLLIIYCIDKDSNTNSNERMPLNAKYDVIGIQVCIPGERKQSFIKKVTVRLPEEEKEDVVEEKNEA